MSTASYVKEALTRRSFGNFQPLLDQHCQTRFDRYDFIRKSIENYRDFPTNVYHTFCMTFVRFDKIFSTPRLWTPRATAHNRDEAGILLKCDRTYRNPVKSGGYKNASNLAINHFPIFYSILPTRFSLPR